MDIEVKIEDEFKGEKKDIKKQEAYQKESNEKYEDIKNTLNNLPLAYKIVFYNKKIQFDKKLKSLFGGIEDIKQYFGVK